jgi:HEAT repeat protein/beta-lactamase regulating signal transducer with metallopeptidase domain
MTAMTGVFANLGAAAAAWLLTYWLHSTLLLGCAWALHRWVLQREAWREVIWKAALVGGLVTATVSVAGFRPWGLELSVPWPGAAVSSASAPAQVLRDDVGQATDRSSAEELTGSSTALAGSLGEGIAGAVSEEVTHQAAMPQDASERASGVGTLSSDGESEGAALQSDDAKLGSALTGALRANVSTVVLAAWASITLILLGALVRRHVRLHRILSDRRTVSDGPLPAMLAGLRRSTGVWQPVRLSATGSVATPLALGRSEICVPECFLDRLGEEEQMAALAHELGHLARRDPTWHLATQTIEAAFFFQPLNRVARLKLRESAEYLADEWAVRQTGSRLVLARCLAQVADWVSSVEAPELAGTIAMAEGGSPLLARVRRLLEREAEAPTAPAASKVAAVTLIALTAGFAPAVSSTVSSIVPSSDEKTLEREAVDNESAPAEMIVQTVEVTRVAANGALVDRMRAADQMAASAGARAYWVAYAMEGGANVSDQIAMDTSPLGNWPERSAAIEGLLRVTDDVGPAGSGDVIVLAQQAPQSPRPRIVRLSMRSPGLGIDLQGRPVYWLGRVSAEESLAWAQSVFQSAGQDAQLREGALELVGHHPLPQARALLMNVATEDENPEVRVEAVEELANHPVEQAVDLLADLAASDRDPNVRQEATETLGEMASVLAGEALQSLISNAGDIEIRREALEALTDQAAVQQSDTILAAVLLEMALNDPDPDLRLEAVEGMEELFPEVAVPLLRRVLAQSNDRQVRLEVVETLGDIGTVAALSALDELLEEPDTEVALQVVEAISEMPPEFSEPRLARIVRTHPSVEVRYEALEYLGEGGGELAGEVLIEIALAGGSTELSTEAVDRIEELAAEQAVAALQRVVLESQNIEVRVEATESLGSVGGNAAVQALDRIVREVEVESIVIAAVESLGEIETNAARTILSRLATQHPSPRVRREARSALGGG